ncbi:hypothetical protein [Xanthobacter autotrophicus]|uniref:hypothetical protein n=1 Tax=Xanthobacter autotrophicus TaxID=280 RepID=UPI0024A77A77|nr:hypothetical protein [Xanthobacter autotrophicus]MDI4656576.1 hypothetical protein [Xanthobacter autotrophicus]
MSFGEVPDIENGGGASQARCRYVVSQFELRHPLATAIVRRILCYANKASKEVCVGRFELIFDGDDIASSRGSAWIGVRAQTHAGRLVITHDCGSPAELESAVRDLKAELDNLVERSRAKFERNLREKISKDG